MVVSAQLSRIDEPYLARRQSFRTSLRKRGPSPQRWTDDPLPGDVTKVEYESGSLKLKAWLFRPGPGQQARRPALVYLHGGFAFGEDDFAECRPFTQAGFIVLCPTFRGENGNPGIFEMMFGEVDDAAAAIRWLATQEQVDPERIYVFGHSSGGVMAGLLALYDSLPIRHTGSAGGLYGTDLFALLPEAVPFDAADKNERQLRVLVGNIRWMKRTHYAFIGKQDVRMQKDEAMRQANSLGAPLKVVELPGDHHSSLAPAMRQYLKIALEDK
jgi:acetyl esterase/lipase